jgi:xanthine dehydrogenase accessory factor
MESFYRMLKTEGQKGDPFALTVISGEGKGEKALVSDETFLYRSDPDGIFSGAMSLGELKDGSVITVGQSTVFAERTGSTPTAVICGAGYVAIAILKMARMTGMRVICIDDRPRFADDARRAGCDQVICEAFPDALGKVTGDENTYFIIVTRGHRWDEDCLRRILEKKSAYIGMMGSRKRVAIVRNRLEEEGYAKEALEAVHAPIGLPIGAETPEEIAVSVLAEIISVKNSRGMSGGYPSEILEGILSGMAEPSVRQVLATIVKRKGSAPRGVGTKMLIRSDGSTAGTIGGGCAEAEVLQAARSLLASGHTAPRLMTVDLMNDTAAEEGMVCGGIMDVYLEVI